MRTHIQNAYAIRAAWVQMAKVARELNTLQRLLENAPEIGGGALGKRYLIGWASTHADLYEKTSFDYSVCGGEYLRGRR